MTTDDTTAPKRPRGRPRGPGRESFMVRLTPDEAAQARALAEHVGLPVATWLSLEIRRRLRARGGNS